MVSLLVPNVLPSNDAPVLPTSDFAMFNGLNFSLMPTALALKFCDIVCLRDWPRIAPSLILARKPLSRISLRRWRSSPVSGCFFAIKASTS